MLFMLTTPNLAFPVLASPLSYRLVDSTCYSLSPLRCLIGGLHRALDFSVLLVFPFSMTPIQLCEIHYGLSVIPLFPPYPTSSIIFKILKDYANSVIIHVHCYHPHPSVILFLDCYKPLNSSSLLFLEGPFSWFSRPAVGVTLCKGKLFKIFKWFSIFLLK